MQGVWLLTPPRPTSNRCVPQRFSEENLKERANRFASLLKILELDHLIDEEKESLLEVLDDFLYQFHLPGDKLGTASLLTHKIITVDEKPVQMKQYRYSQTLKEEVNRQVKDLLDKGMEDGYRLQCLK